MREINRQGTIILLVEQNVFNALGMSQTGYVHENGRVVLQGAARELLDNETYQECLSLDLEIPGHAGHHDVGPVECKILEH